MTKLTKDEVRQFTPEQQVAFASMMAQRVRARQELVERVQRSSKVVTGLLMGMAGGLAILSVAYPRALLFGVIAVTALVGHAVAGFNRRIEALMELLDHDNKQTAETEHGDNPAAR
jgi:hypothetical protein